MLFVTSIGLWGFIICIGLWPPVAALFREASGPKPEGWKVVWWRAERAAAPAAEPAEGVQPGKAEGAAATAKSWARSMVRQFSSRMRRPRSSFDGGDATGGTTIMEDDTAAAPAAASAKQAGDEPQGRAEDAAAVANGWVRSLVRQFSSRIRRTGRSSLDGVDATAVAAAGVAAAAAPAAKQTEAVQPGRAAAAAAAAGTWERSMVRQFSSRVRQPRSTFEGVAASGGATEGAAAEDQPADAALLRNPSHKPPGGGHKSAAQDQQLEVVVKATDGLEASVGAVPSFDRRQVYQGRRWFQLQAMVMLAGLVGLAVLDYKRLSNPKYCLVCTGGLPAGARSVS